MKKTILDKQALNRRVSQKEIKDYDKFKQKIIKLEHEEAIRGEWGSKEVL
jgi:hypothetical protein